MPVINNKKVILLIIILAQLICVLYVASRKQEFHIDEMYSYVLSNSYHADKISSDDSMWGRWVDSDDLSEFITVQNGERFAFDKVYKNNTTDAHPPLYYWFLHSVCSIFPGIFSKWMGLGLNIIFYIVSIIVLYLVSDLITDNKILVYLPVVLYGFSPIALETLTFIRMYMLITMLAVLLIYVHLRMLTYGCNKKRMLAAWIIIYLGSMTHYYYIVFSFWCAAIFILQNIRCAKKKAIAYGAGCFASVALFILSYPYVIAQAAGTSTNNVGNEIRKNLFNWPLWAYESKLLLKSQIDAFSYSHPVSILLAIVMICIVLFLAAYFALHIHSGRDKQRRELISGEWNTTRFIQWTGLVYLLTFLSISFIGGEYVFLRYIYFIGPALYILIAYLISCLCRIRPGFTAGLAAVLALFAVSNAAYGSVSDSSPYLLREAYADNIRLSAYAEKPLIVISERNPAVPTGNLTKIKIFDQFYMAGLENVIGNDVVGACLRDEGECILYITTDTYYLDGYNAQVVLDDIENSCQTEDFKSEYICAGCLGEFYRVKAAS